METTPNPTSAYNITNSTWHYYYYGHDYYYEDPSWNLDEYLLDTNVVLYSVIFCIVLPMICIAIYGLCRLVRPDHVAPVFVINLFISDLIQVSANLFKSIFEADSLFLYYGMWITYNYCIMVNIFFMVCISGDRFLMIVYPVRHRNFQNIKNVVFVAVSIWIVLAVIQYVIEHYNYSYEFWVSTMLLPYPLVLFFFVGTWRALARSSLPLDNQRRIMGTLGLVLGIYTVLFLPYLIMLTDDFGYFLYEYYSWRYLLFTSKTLVALNPIFDFLLYVLMRRDAKRIFYRIFFCFKPRQEVSTITRDTRESD